MSDASTLLSTLTAGMGANEEHILINADRSVVVPEGLRKIAVQNDHNIETVTFDCPRYWDGIDMSEMTVCINYMRPDNVTGCYTAQNVAVDNVDLRIMHFEWTLTRNATAVKGSLKFLVCIKKTDADGNLVNHWSSELNSQMTVSEGLECGEHIAEEYPDVITRILLELDEKADADDVYGQSTIAGHNGYYIHSINTREKWIILSDAINKPAYPAIGVSVTDDSNTSFVTGYAVGDVFSTVNGAHYDFCGTITNIVGNKIYYEEDLPFNTIDTTTNDFDDHIFFVPAKPDIGPVQIVTIAFATGIGTKAPGKCSFGAGRDGVAGGDYSFIAGRRTFAAYCAAALGLDCYSYGRYSFSVCRFCEALGEYSAAINMGTTARGEASFTHGKGTEANSEAMEAGGKWNKTKDGKIIVYGNGYSNADGSVTRSDAYSLDWNGDGWYAGSVDAENNINAGKDVNAKGNIMAEEHINSKFIKEDYFDNGKVSDTLHDIKDFDGFVEPGYYHFVWYHKVYGGTTEEITPWNITVSVDRENGKTFKIYQMREAFGSNSGGRYWKDTRIGEVGSDGSITWSEWVDVVTTSEGTTTTAEDGNEVEY